MRKVSEETLKEAVQLVNVEGFSFDDRNTKVDNLQVFQSYNSPKEEARTSDNFDRGGGTLSGPVDSELINMKLFVLNHFTGCNKEHS